MNISNKRLAKGDALAINNSRCISFANGQSLMHGKKHIAHRKFLTINIINECKS